MKKTLTVIVCLVGSLTAFSQGYVNFANLGTGVNSKFNDVNGVALTGTGYMVELLAGQTSPTDSLTPVFMGSFASGYFNGGSVTVPAADIDASGNSVFQVRVWNTLGGTITSYAAAIATGSGSSTGVTASFTVKPQVSTTLPPAALAGMPLINGTGNLTPTPAVVPEPSVLAMAFLGLGALFIRRRK
jgi:PEP-CTERM motif